MKSWKLIYMKFLKISIATAFIFASVMACTRQNIDDSTLQSSIATSILVPYTGGQAQD